MKLSVLAGLGVMAGAVSAAIKPIEVKGNAFFEKGGDKRFYIRGVDYQPGGTSNDLKDPIADAKSCKRDVKYFKELGINTVRVYSVDNSEDHDECMKALADAGIYLLLDVNTPKHSLNRADPKPSYNAGYLQTIFATIDAFKDYDNVLGFFAANEVINSENSTKTAPYVKAVVRDMKKYIKKQSKRQIPVGYSAADIADNRWEQMQYFNCGDEEERIDMFGMNDYSWCGKSSFSQSGYEANVKKYSDYSIPMFLSEFGCNKVTPRPFTEIEALYDEKMTKVYSGGLVYEYSQEDSNYGLVKIKGDDVSKLDDFDTLKKQYEKVSNPSGDGGAKTDGKASTCPKYKKGTWDVDEDKEPPSTPKDAEDYFDKGAGKKLGFDAPNTQAGSTSAPKAGGGSSSSSDSDSDSSDSSSSSTSTSSDSAAGIVQIPSLSAIAVPAGLLVSSFVLGASLI